MTRKVRTLSPSSAQVQTSVRADHHFGHVEGMRLTRRVLVEGMLERQFEQRLAAHFPLADFIEPELATLARVLVPRLPASTLTADSCVDALGETIMKYGPPEVMNADQGRQFTRLAFLSTTRFRSAWMARAAGGITFCQMPREVREI